MNEHERQCAQSPPFDVMVIAWQDERVVYTLGEAVLEGYFELGDMSAPTEQSKERPALFTNMQPDESGRVTLPISPRIRFASGDVVWGCECYWVPLAFWNSEGKDKMLALDFEFHAMTYAEFRAAQKANEVQTVEEMVAIFREHTGAGCDGCIAKDT